MRMTNDDAVSREVGALASSRMLLLLLLLPPAASLLLLPPAVSMLLVLPCAGWDSEGTVQGPWEQFAPAGPCAGSEGAGACPST